MTHEEMVDLFHEAMAAYRREGIEGYLPFVTPDIEIHAEPQAGNAGTYHGREGVLRWTAIWDDAWEGITYEAQQFESKDDELLVKVLVDARGKGSGVPVQMHIWWVFTARDGKVARWRLYVDEGRARAAAGLDPATAS